MRAALAIALAALLAAPAAAEARPRKPAKTQRDSAWMRDCIRDSMANAAKNNTSGATTAGAREYCRSIQPEDEVEAAKQQLRIARANAKVTRARARVLKASESAARAMEACHQAVVDRCVELATPSSPAEGPGSCMDDGLAAELQLVCNLQVEGK